MNATDTHTVKLAERLARRETHSSRAALSIVAASVLFIAVVWLAMELVLGIAGKAPLLISPAEVSARTASLATDTLPGALVGAGVVVALVGFALFAAALLPGAKPRHIMASGRAAVVVDSEVLAAAVSRAARTAARLAPEQVTSIVGRKRIAVALRPSPGMAVDTGAVRDAVDRELSGDGLGRPLRLAITTGAGS